MALDLDSGGPDNGDPLTWLGDILWPDGSTAIVAGHPRSSGAASWWASPSADRPKVLVPATSRAAARTAVFRYHDGFSPVQRLRSLAAETVMANRRFASLLLGRAAVHATPNRSGGVLEEIAKVMGVDDLIVAVGLSTPKSNRKPVLQLLDRGGDCLGWAKVAWNERTEALVGNEAHWLRWADGPPDHEAEGPPGHGADGPPGSSRAGVVMPTLLHDRTLCGRRVVITSGVTPSRRPRRAGDLPPAPEVFRAVAALGTPTTAAIAETPWWRSVEAARATADPRECRAIQAVADSVAELRFEVGAWHGDLAPWNLMTTADGVQLIDWEFAADGAPLGFDLCHFHTQVAAEMKGATPAASLDRSARLSPQGLARLGVAPENRRAVWHVYLVELLRRSLALRADGYPTDKVHQGPAALDRIERIFGIDGSQVPSSIRPTRPGRSDMTGAVTR